MQNITDFRTDTVVKFDRLSFLTSERMFELGCHYASDHLQYGDRVRVLHDIDGFAGGMVGTFQSSLGSTASIVFDSTNYEQSLSQYDLALTFEPLDLVEVVLGRHKGLRGMVVMIEDHEVSVVDENDTTNLVMTCLIPIVDILFTLYVCLGHSFLVLHSDKSRRLPYTRPWTCLWHDGGCLPCSPPFCCW